MSASGLSVSIALAKREATRFVRQRARVIAALATPLMLWVIAGMGMGDAFTAPPGIDGNYLSYIFPGIVVLTVVFAAIFGAFSTIEDRSEGFMQGVLVAPIPRWSIALGKSLGAAFIAWIQGLLILLLVFATDIHVRPLNLVLGAGWLALIAIGQAGLGFAFAWRSPSTQAFHGIMNLVLLPMWILSGAMFPAESAYAVVNAVMDVNPLRYGLDGLRNSLSASSNEDFGVNLIVTIGFAAMMLLWSTFVVSRRSVTGIGRGPGKRSS